MRHFVTLMDRLQGAANGNGDHGDRHHSEAHHQRLRRYQAGSAHPVWVAVGNVACQGAWTLFFCAEIAGDGPHTGELAIARAHTQTHTHTHAHTHIHTNFASSMLAFSHMLQYEGTSSNGKLIIWVKLDRA